MVASIMKEIDPEVSGIEERQIRSVRTVNGGFNLHSFCSCKRTNKKIKMLSLIKFPTDNQAFFSHFRAWLLSYSFSIHIKHITVCFVCCLFPEFPLVIFSLILFW